MNKYNDYIKSKRNSALIVHISVSDQDTYHFYLLLSIQIYEIMLILDPFGYFATRMT